MVSNSSGMLFYILELFAAGEPGGNGPGGTEVLTEPGPDAAGIRCQEGREHEDQHRQYSTFQLPAHYHAEERRHPALSNCLHGSASYTAHVFSVVHISRRKRREQRGKRRNVTNGQQYFMLFCESSKNIRQKTTFFPNMHAAGLDGRLNLE